MRNPTQKKILNFFSLLVVALIINLPVAAALEISAVNSAGISASGAQISWVTDEDADSLVRYGTSTDDLSQTVSGSTEVTDHRVQIEGLESETTYYYEVESSDQVDDNSGSYYSFTTLASSLSETEDETETIVEQVEELVLDIEIPDIAQGTTLTLEGSVNPGATVNMYVNGQIMSSLVASGGTFSFTNIVLAANSQNSIEIEAILGEQVIFVTGSVLTDGIEPDIEYTSLPDYSESQTTQISGTVSEPSRISITVDGEEMYSAEGQEFNAQLNLEEGLREVHIIAQDPAGNRVVDVIEIAVDFSPPEIRNVIFEKGHEYYEGVTLNLKDPEFSSRSSTKITGESEAGSTVYLFMYRPLGYEYVPEFNDPVAEVVVDDDGNFVFENINFGNNLPTLEDFKPIQVPPGLLDVSVFPSESVEQAQSFTYHIFFIAVDATGKVAFHRDSVTINTCFSSNFDFAVSDLVEFQRPLRLDPGLLDEGREEAHTVFQLEYQGTGYPPVSRTTAGIDQQGTYGGRYGGSYGGQYGNSVYNSEPQAYQINSVRFEKACTQAMTDDKYFGLGCNLLANNIEAIPSPDRLSYYLNFQLNSAEKFSKADDNFWNEFKERQVKFPLKVVVNYQEYDEQGNLGPSKSQASCYDVGYQVDIPLDSEKLIPDWLANDVTAALNTTIGVIDEILPFVEKAVLITGYACFGSTAVRAVVRAARIFSAKMEALQGEAAVLSGQKERGEECPLDQRELYLDKTLDHWEQLYSEHTLVRTDGLHQLTGKAQEYVTGGVDKEEVSLDTRCPQTAGLWRTEATIDTAYRWSCDRFLCRAVPAKWTEDKVEEDINLAYAAQRSCSVTSGCVPLREIENCDEYIRDNRNTLQRVGSGTTCWEKVDSDEFVGNQFVSNLYVVSSDQDSLGDQPVTRLERVGSATGLTYDTDRTILAYQQPGTDGFCAASGATCSQVCQRRGLNYRPVTDGVGSNGQCYTQVPDEESGGKYTVLVDREGRRMSADKVAAGFTSDCFVGDYADIRGVAATAGSATATANGTTPSAEVASTGDGIYGDLAQCVCDTGQPQSVQYSVREAAPKAEDGATEDFIYRQDRMFKESSGIGGVYYPSWRYYKGRDLSGAFGTNHIADYARPGNEKFPEVNPKTQPISTWQSACVSGIYNQLRLVRSILEGLNNCINEAKYTGFQDAGMCKTLFSQHVCGLVYKMISALQNSCVPSNINDDAKNKQGVGIGEFLSTGSEAISQSLDSSFEDLKADYGNANLNEYLSGGVQGFTQSICLAAFGFDFPIGNDFIMDTAYSVAGRTSPLVVPAVREFSHYNPATSKVAYNYEVGVAVFPGCRVARLDTYLKCVGPDDIGNEGVSCKAGECDCLNAYDQSPFEVEKEIRLPGGTANNIESGGMIDLPIESPQKIESNFRYDHVMIKMTLDPNYRAEDCFPDGHITGERTGVFYTPIKDVTPDAIGSCQIQPTTGQISCPELNELFYDGGSAYLEAPYISCYEASTDTYVDCTTPNLFTLEDESEVRIKTYMSLDTGNYCLKVDANGAGITYGTQVLSLPKGLAGQRQPSISLGKVGGTSFGARDASIIRTNQNQQCNQELQILQKSGTVSGKPFVFSYQNYGDNTFGIEIVSDEPTLDVITDGYDLSGGHKGKLILVSDPTRQLTYTEINSVQFSLDGVTFSGILSSVATGSGSCNYLTRAGSQGATSLTEGYVDVSVTLLQADDRGLCNERSRPVLAQSGLGRSSDRKRILIQKERTETSIGSPMHPSFIQGDYTQTQQIADQFILANEGTLNEAVGIYYMIASVIAQGGSSWQLERGPQILLMLDRFFKRQGAVETQRLLRFPTNDISTGEFQAIRAYLCVIAEQLGAEVEYETTQPGSEIEYGCADILAVSR